jgi:hypothetical protein
MRSEMDSRTPALQKNITRNLGTISAENSKPYGQAIVPTTPEGAGSLAPAEIQNGFRA